MRIKVPFHYSVGYIPFRHHNTQTAFFASETEVEIREIEAERAPVAFVLARRGENYGFRFRPTSDGRPRKMLWFEGKFWIENGTAEVLRDVIENQQDPKNTPFAMCKHVRAFKGQNPEYNVQITDRRNLEAKNPRMRSFDDDGGKKMAKLLARRADDVIIVDGAVYEREYEPCLQVGVENGHIKVELSCEEAHPKDPFAFDYRLVLWDKRKQWNILQLDEAVEFARRRAGADLPVETRFDLEILMPQTAVCAAHSQSVIVIAEAALRDLAQVAPGLTPDAAAAMYELRDALAEIREDVSHRLIAALQAVADLPEADDSEIQRLRAKAAARPGRQEKSWGPTEPSRPEKAVEAASSGVPKARQNALEALGRMETKLSGISWEEDGLKDISFTNGSYVSREILSLDAAKRLGATLGVDLTELAESARSGECRLLEVTASEDRAWLGYVGEEPITAAVLVSRDSHEVVAAIGSGGAEPPAEAVSAAAAHAGTDGQALEGVSSIRCAAAV